MNKLTEEQQKLVTENHNLIYSFLKLYHLNVEEYYDIAAIGLCKAAIYFDKSKGIAFSTYAYKVMYSQILCTKRSEKSQKTIPSNQIVSYNVEVTNEEGNKSSFLNYIPSKENMEEDAVFRVSFEKFIKKLKNENDKKVLELMKNGYTQDEIAKKFNCTNSNISRIRSKLKKNWDVFLEEDE